MNQQALKTLDSGLRGQIGSLSVVVTELMTLLEQDDVELDVLQSLLSKDQALAARVLRIANSPFYGLSRRVASLHDATVVLGVHTIRNVVTAAGVIALFDDDSPQAFSRVKFWQHAIGTGVASRVLAGRCNQDPEVAFTAGLLHDVGKLILQTLLPDEFARIMQHCWSEKCLIRESEATILGFDHTFVGAKAAEMWRLPLNVRDAIGGHHSVSAGNVELLTHIVHVSDIVSRGLDIGCGGDPFIPELAPESWRAIGIAWEEMPGLLAEVERLNQSANLIL